MFNHHLYRTTHAAIMNSFNLATFIQFNASSLDRKHEAFGALPKIADGCFDEISLCLSLSLYAFSGEKLKL